MDIINSVTQNSNNRNIIMENQGDDDCSNNGSQSKPTGMTAFEVVEKKPNVADYLNAIGMNPRKFWPKKYRFTREKCPGALNPLTIAQRNFYETNGYIVLDDCVSHRLLDQIISSKNQQAELYSNDNATKDSDFVDEFFLDNLLSRNGRLTTYVKCFCDDEFMLMTHRFVEHFRANEQTDGAAATESQESSRNVNGNNRQALFPDWVYLPFRPIDKVVGTIVALEPIDHVVLLVPGTHRVGQCTISSTIYSQQSDAAQETREVYERLPDRLSTLMEKSRKGSKYINMKPGQTLFYHPGLLHGFSDDLINFNKRQLAALAYYAASDCEFVDLKNSSLLEQQHIQESVVCNWKVPISLAHFGGQDPRDYRSWLDKPRSIAETKANL